MRVNLEAQHFNRQFFINNRRVKSLIESCAHFEPDPGLLTDRLHLRSPTSIETAPRWHTSNLRSSAFVCGLGFAEAPDINFREVSK